MSRGFRVVALLLMLGAVCCAGGGTPTPKPAAPAAAPPVAAAAPSSAPAAAAPRSGPLSPPAVVHAATTPSISNGGRYIAMERGYFAEEGIEIEDVPSDTSAQLFPALAAGQIDLLAGGPTSGLYNAIAQGIPVRIVLDQWTSFPGNEAGGVLLRKDLIDSGRVREPADLRGLKLSMTSKGHTTQKLLATLLQQGGLSLDDVETIELSYPDLNVALGTRNVDGGTTIEPFGTAAVSGDYAVRWRSWADIVPNDAVALIMYSQAFAEEKNEVAKRYARAYVRGLRDYNQARTTGRDREEIIAILQKYTTLKDRAVYDQLPWPSSNPDGRVNGDAVAAVQDWLYDRGYVTTKVDLSKVIDHQFADYAVQQLGPYQSAR